MTIPVDGSTPELKTDPDVQVAEPAVQVVKEVEGNAGDGEKKPMLSKEEHIQVIHQKNSM